MSSEDRTPCALEREPLSDPLILRMLGSLLQSDILVQRHRAPHVEMIGSIRDRFVKVSVDDAMNGHFISSWLLDVVGYHYCVKCAQKISLQLEWGCLTGKVDCRITSEMPSCAVSLSSEWCRCFSEDVIQAELGEDGDTLVADEYLSFTGQASVESIEQTVEVGTVRG